ncbi:MAG: TlpA family protein disulfide reductase, partial [Phycisphaerales bacterium]|nr:TlpA family protein disulfide reductase [Phycisphaerales bacterium]
MTSRIPVLSLLPAALVASCLAAAPFAQDDKKSEVNPRWLEKMDNLDRSLLDENIGYAAPEMPTGLEWKETDKPLSWEGLRGKVVVVQSWTTKDSPGRAAIERAENVLKPFGEQVVVIGLHTPDGADAAEKFLKQREMTMPIILDREGKFCDEFGFFRKPANVVIDRHGIIRYAGLNPNGLREAVKGLIDEAFDPEKKGEPRPAPELKDTSDIEWPPHNTGRLSAANVQGKKGPALFAETWVSAQPDLTGKVVIIDFSATWCPPCRASFPHMSQLQEKFRGSLEIIAITNETPQAFRDGLTKYNIAPASIKFSVASDPATRT